MTVLTVLVIQAWNVLLVAAPFLLVGMVTAGLLHVLLARRVIERWLGQEGLLGVAVAACLGIPLPLCSCGVVPVAMALRRKGASRPASLAFLITTPESGADSILLTWGMLGPIMAIARPLASFFTALVAGMAAIASPSDPGTGERGLPASHERVDESLEDDAHVVGPREFLRSLYRYVWPIGRRTGTPKKAGRRAEIPAFEDIARDVFHYAFVDLADDIAFWLVVGVFLAAVITLVVPDDLAARGLGSGLVPMLGLLLLSVPVYLCASASTPVAAALVAKGISPGAVLVFLLAGPATNVATLVLLTRHFGARFVRIYLGSVVFATLACGVTLDWLIGVTGWQVQANLSGGLGGGALIEWLSALAMVAILSWRLWAGAARRGVRELVLSLENLSGIAAENGEARRRLWFRNARRIGWLAAAAGVLLYVLGGVRVIPPDARGFGFLFGRLVWPDLAPGLHYVPPMPFGRCDVWRVAYPRIAGVGFTPDQEAVANRRQLTEHASGDLWHSPVTATTSDTQNATYLTGDENLIEISFAVQYGLSDPRAFFYGLDRQGDAVRLYAEAAAREFVARQTFDDLLTSGRAKLEAAVASDLQQRLDSVGAGAVVTAVLLVDIHPPQGAVGAFRDVSSAREERETTINVAGAAQAQDIPLARGQAAVDVASAQAAAATAETVAGGQAQALRAQAEAFGRDPGVLGNLLWVETAERVLGGREKLIVPPGSAGQNLVVWRDAPAAAAAGTVPAAPPRRLPPLPPAPSGPEGKP